MEPIKGKPAESHAVERIGWLRAAVLGANDGIVSTASLIVGVAAAATDKGPIMVAGVAGLVAGAMSMAAGEYVSVSSQADTEAADLARERGELADMPEFELAELTGIYVARGLPEPLARQVAEALTGQPCHWRVSCRAAVLDTAGRGRRKGRRRACGQGRPARHLLGRPGDGGDLCDRQPVRDQRGVGSRFPPHGGAGRCCKPIAEAIGAPNRTLFRTAARWKRNPAYAFSSVHCSGCWFCLAKSITWFTLVSAIS